MLLLLCLSLLSPAATSVETAAQKLRQYRLALQLTAAGKQQRVSGVYRHLAALQVWGPGPAETHKEAAAVSPLLGVSSALCCSSAECKKETKEIKEINKRDIERDTGGRQEGDKRSKRDRYKRHKEIT